MSSPRLGIGLPVRNGERFLRDALDALLAQTFGDFELVVCDNASDDATEEIARDYAKRDARVRYHRAEENAGAAANFNRAFELTQGEFFKWVAHDDVHEPEYLEACIGVLDAQPDVVLCHSLVRFIDEQGAVVSDHEPRLHALDSPRRIERFRDLTRIGHWCFDVFGVMRRDVAARTPRIAPYAGSDRNLLVELGLHGRLFRVPRPLFLSRDHGARSIRSMTHLRDRTPWFDPAASGRRVYPHWRHLVEYHRSLKRAGVPFFERARCNVALLSWMRHHRRYLLDDLRSHAGGGAPS